jgi:hypothetical protein
MEAEEALRVEVWRGASLGGVGAPHLPSHHVSTPALPQCDHGAQAASGGRRRLPLHHRLRRAGNCSEFVLPLHYFVFGFIIILVYRRP